MKGLGQVQDLASLALAGMDWRAHARSRDPVEQALTIAVLEVVYARLSAENS